MRTALALAVLAVALTACGSASQAPASPVPGRTGPAATPAAGPFRVRLTACTGSTATATVTSTGHRALAVQVEAAFYRHGLVEDSNTSGFTSPIPPGQSERVTIGNVTSTGKAGNPADSCELLDYAVMNGSTYAGTWPRP